MVLLAIGLFPSRKKLSAFAFDTNCRDLTLMVDSSTIGTGAVLLQKDRKTGEEVPVAKSALIVDKSITVLPPGKK